MTSVLLPTTAAPLAPKRDIPSALRRFRPRLALGYQDELYRLTRRLESMPHEEGVRELSQVIEAVDRRLVQYEGLGLAVSDLLPTLQWATALRVLRDLHMQGWAFQTDDEGLLLKAPGTSVSADPEVEKEAVRRSFAFARKAQFAEPSATRFIRGLERRGVGLTVELSQGPVELLGSVLRSVGCPLCNVCQIASRAIIALCNHYLREPSIDCWATCCGGAPSRCAL